MMEEKCIQTQKVIREKNETYQNSHCCLHHKNPLKVVPVCAMKAQGGLGVVVPLNLKVMLRPLYLCGNIECTNRTEGWACRNGGLDVSEKRKHLSTLSTLTLFMSVYL